jgi:hypothetical protein
MTRVIELVEKNVQDELLYLIAECNDYDQTGRRINQLSRSPFLFNAAMPDEDIIELIRIGAYSIYFN